MRINEVLLSLKVSFELLWTAFHQTFVHLLSAQMIIIIKTWNNVAHLVHPVGADENGKRFYRTSGSHLLDISAKKLSWASMTCKLRRRHEGITLLHAQHLCRCADA
jgi:hypothetical protein